MNLDFDYLFLYKFERNLRYINLKEPPHRIKLNPDIPADIKVYIYYFVKYLVQVVFLFKLILVIGYFTKVFIEIRLLKIYLDSKKEAFANVNKRN